MSDFNYQPLRGASIAREPRVLSANFGDGYQQRVGDGINTNPQAWSLSFTNTTAIIDTIEAFFILQAGVTAFTWTPEGGSEIKVVCPKWTRIKAMNGVETLSAEFGQVFE